jgi:hypothetical protein
MTIEVFVTWRSRKVLSGKMRIGWKISPPEKVSKFGEFVWRGIYGFFWVGLIF